MTKIFTRRISTTSQYIYGFLSVLAVSSVCYGLSDYIGYRTVALLLLVTVSIIAMFFEILPVLSVAVLSALTWDFFFIPPSFTLHINSGEDGLMFMMYFVIAMLNATLTFKIRQVEKKNRLKEEKEKTLKLYNTLLNSLSHELRTPIATIIGATDNLQTNAEKLSRENQADLLAEISKASLRLNRQVENLLNMSRLESGAIRPRFDWCDIQELVFDVVNRIKEDPVHQPVSIIIGENMPLFRIDFGLIGQVLYNLIYNAVQYTSKYCIITVRALCKEDHLVLIVEDNGSGFPGETIDRAFDKFYRLEHTQTGGTGLGLSIVKGFVEAHNGTVTLENADQGGAKFTIVIPAEVSYLSNLRNE